MRRHLRRLQTLSAVMPRRLRTAHGTARVKGFGAADLVTLDVFDTALLRSVARPEDVFALVAWRVAQRHGVAVDMAAFAQARRAAEIAARAAVHHAGWFEISLASIYRHFPGDTSAALLAWAQVEEVLTEQDVCYANPDILSLYRRLIAAGTPVAFLSDTYLDADVIAGMLQARGYTGVHRVFASSAYNLTKGDGNLFAAVARDTGVAPGRIWHIGDNARSDVIQARRAGWNGLWYRPRLRPPAPPPPVADPAGFIAASLLSGIPACLQPGRAGADVWARMGQTIAAPIYIGFAQWLLDQVAKSAPGLVLFCARDGRIVKAVYDRLAPASGIAIDARYLMVSRRALVFPAIEALGAAELHLLCGNFTGLRLEAYLSRIGLQPAACAAVARQHGLDLEDEIDSPARDAALRAVIMALEPDILAIARRERAVLCRYLQQEGCLDGGALALVDVGWHGSLQKALAAIVSSEAPATTIAGYYFGTHEDVVRIGPAAGTTLGWFVDAGRPEDRDRIARTQWAILEFLFTAPHGSVLGYAETEGRVQAVLQEHESPAANRYGQAAAEVQAAALETVDRYIAAFGGLRPAPVGIGAVLPPLQALVFQPSRRQAAAIGDLFQIDGFGATQRGQYVAKPPAIAALLRSPLQMIRGYQQVPWRRGYLVRLLGDHRLASVFISSVKLVRPGFRTD